MVALTRKFTRLILAIVWVLLGAGVSTTPAFAQRPRMVTVNQGDTLGRIARRYHVSISTLREANHLRGDALRAGQSLWVPREGEVAAPDADQATRREVQRGASDRARRIGIGRARVAQQLLVRPAERRWVVAAGEGRLPGTLQYPIRGAEVIRGWGSGPGGYHLAVDFRAPVGSPIHAVERGIVVYAGGEISEYGNLVMIQHPNGWVSAYAHNRENLVSAGQMVRRDEVVARLGSTGLSRGPHLHFMLIYEGEHCDPMPLFRPRRGLRGAQATWRRGRPPSEVQCLPRSARPHPHPRHLPNSQPAPGSTVEIQPAIPDDDDEAEPSVERLEAAATQPEPSDTEAQP